jgi:hypothetical protein
MLDESVFDFISSLKDLSERLMLKQMVFHMTSQKLFEQFALLSNEISGACDHLGQPSIHLMLVLASSHAVKLTQLFNKLVHRKHGRS